MLQVIESRQRDLGEGFMVRRLLPAIGRKMVGPFIFLDHMGPAHFNPGEGLNVRPHPHINLATVTYLFEGAILHRDSVGSEQIIRPGDINWMTAGRGIVHSERTPADVLEKGGTLDGIQCWVALPRAHEETEPSFVHHPSHTLPSMQLEGVEVKLLLGSAFGMQSPVHSFSDILYLDLKMQEGARLEVPLEGRELAIYGAHGSILVNGEAIAERALVVATEVQGLRIEARSAARLVIVGGKPLPERRVIWWNFVSSSQERIERAKADWTQGKFPKVPGDDEEFIPLPEENPAPHKPAGTIL